MSEVQQAFRELLFGSGAWLGLLLILVITVGLLRRWRHSAVFLIPIMIFLGIDYLDEGLRWHALIMWFSSIFTVIYIARAR